MRYTTHYIALLLVMTILSACNSISIGKGGDRDSVRIREIMEHQAKGEALRNKGLFYEALSVYDSCINESRQLGDTMQIVSALNNQGTTYRRLGDIKEASDYHMAALELSDAYSDKKSDLAVKNNVKSLNGLGNVLMTLGNLKAAEVLFLRALNGEKSLGSATGQAINLANLGSIKEKENKIDSARIYYNQSMEMNRKDNNLLGISLCYRYLGHLDELSGNTGAASANYHQSYSTGLATGDVWHWFEPCAALAQLYINMHRTDSARIFTQEAMTAAKQTHSMEHLSTAYALQSQLAELDGNMAQALSDYKLSHSYEDSVKNENNTVHLHNLRLDYEVKRHAQEVQMEKEKTQSEHRKYLILVAFVIVIAIIFFVADAIHRRTNKLRQEAAQTLEHANEQLRKASNDRQLFYRGITHQLRTPLTVVLGMIQQLRKHIPDDDKEGMADLDAAQRQSGELLQLVTRLINASKEGDTELLREHATSAPTPSEPETQQDGTPAAQSSTPEPSLAANDNENAPLVLIAEDNDDVAMLMCNAFTGEGYRTQRAADGRIAMSMLQEQLPDLVVTDIAMPNMSGLELMRNIRADEDMNHLPIIVASARVEDSDRIEGINAGAEVYLAKPFIVDELLLRAQKLIEQRALLRDKFSNGNASEDVPDEVSESERAFMEKLNDVIDQNMMQSNLNSTILCQLMFMSRSQLNRKIKNITNMDTTHYIRERRMAKAKLLLVKTNKSIGEIEAACGFDTQGYLSRMFKQEMGITPSAYRRQEREKHNA